MERENQAQDPTGAAARRLIDFLNRERELLPLAHPWRRSYDRQLIRTLALFPSEAD